MPSLLLRWDEHSGLTQMFVDGLVLDGVEFEPLENELKLKYADFFSAQIGSVFSINTDLRNYSIVEFTIRWFDRTRNLRCPDILLEATRCEPSVTGLTLIDWEELQQKMDVLVHSAPPNKRIHFVDAFQNLLRIGDYSEKVQILLLSLFAYSSNLHSNNSGQKLATADVIQTLREEIEDLFNTDQ